jgi:hypothetical protein
MFVCVFLLLLLVHVLSVCVLHTAVVIVGCKQCRQPWLPMPCMLFGSLVKCLSVPICVWHCAVYRQPELLLHCHHLLLQEVSVCADTNWSMQSVSDLVV